MGQKLLDFAATMDWRDSDVKWTQDATAPAVEVLRRLLQAAGTGVPEEELHVPMWSEGSFSAGRLSDPHHVRFWSDVVLVGHPRREFILDSLRGIRPSRYFRHFKGRFMGQDYDCASPPARAFQNHWPPGMTSTGADPGRLGFPENPAGCSDRSNPLLGKGG